MRKNARYISAVLMILIILPVLSAFGGSNSGWTEPGNSDLNILNGGVMLTDGDDFYFTHDGIFLQTGDTVKALSADDGRNLNLIGDKLYYSLGKNVYRIPARGGERELVHTAQGSIRQLYVMGSRLLYISNSNAYSAEIGGSAELLSAPSGLVGVIPTPYGNLYLTGETLNYTLWAESAAVLSGVQSCYTDSGYLAVQINNENYMAELSRLFSGFSAAALESFFIHGDISLMTLLAPDDENKISESNDNYDLMLDFAALLEEAGLSSGMRLMTENPEIPVIPEVSQGQRNIVKRARQLHEIEWTPLENRAKWGENGYFTAGTTYTGIPYGQPVNSNGYLGYGVSLEQYSLAVLDNTSKFYTSYSTYNKIAPVYSTDCSGYVSYAWGLSSRRTTYSIPQVADKVGEQSLYSIQIGDCLNKQTSHVVLVSDLRYNAEGNIIWLEVMEQTPPITKLTRYGEGESRSLASFQSYYLNGGYVIYRNPARNDVTYTPNAVVPLDGETVAGQKDKAPKVKVSVIASGKLVELYSDVPGATIYYTLDGSTPGTGSTRYSGGISVTDTTKIRAIAHTGMYSGCSILEFTAKIEPVSTPTFSIKEGLSSGSYVSSGSKVSISSMSGATIYYTTDGTTPTTSSPVYSSPISVSSDIKLQAIATAPGYKQSQVASVSYKIGQVYTISASAGSGGSISPSGGKSVVQTGSQTYTITPQNGFKVDNVIVDGASVGAVTSYTFSNVTANHTISASFKSSAVLPFTDVAQGAWYYDAVSYAYANSLFNGTSATTFSPEVAMSRGMFATVLGRLAGVSDEYTGGNVGIVTGSGVNIRREPSTSSEVAGFVSSKYTIVGVTGQSGDWYQVKYGSVTGYIRNDLIKVYSGNYSDLSLNNYYSVFAQWVCLSGVGNGVAGSSFNPDAAITREDMCLMLYNYVNIYGISLPTDVAKTAFTDEAQISSAAKNAVYALQQAGVINGVGDGSFSPRGSGTRSQVAQIFSKYAAITK